MSEDIRQDLKYTKEHEWVQVDGDTAIIGITHYAQEALGDVVFVDLPEAGQTVEAGDDFAVIESVKAASEVYSPVSGTITEVNEALDGAPETLNDAPYEDGWIVKIKLDDNADTDDLLTADDYTAFTESLD